MLPLRILVVDDNAALLKSYTKALYLELRPSAENSCHGETLEVLVAESVEEALSCMNRENNIEILIVDLKLPGSRGQEMGGLEVIDESVKLDPLRTVIVITGYGTLDLARKALSRGIFDFIEKSSMAVKELVGSAKRAIAIRNEKIKRSGNPFAPMAGIEPTVFGGRSRELEFFENKINRVLHKDVCEHFLVLGDWGLGKSTLLREYKKLAQSRGCIGCYVPLEPMSGTPCLMDGCRSIIEGIMRDLPYPVERLRRASDYFNSLGISILGTGLQFSKNSTPQLLPQSFLCDTLVRIWQDVEDRANGLVLFLDDLDNFRAIPEIMMLLRQTFSMETIKRRRILLGVTSTPAMWMGVVSHETAHHPLARYFISSVDLELLSESDTRETILQSLRGSGVSFTEEVIALVYEYSNGHPFEMQVICSHLFNSQMSGGVGKDVWPKALQTAVTDMGKVIFRYWYESSSEEERKMLQLLSSCPRELSISEIDGVAAELGICLKGLHIEKALDKLFMRNLVARTRTSGNRISDRMFAAYLRSYLSSDRSLLL